MVTIVIKSKKEIAALFKQQLSYKQLASLLQVSETTIMNIYAGCPPTALAFICEAMLGVPEFLRRFNSSKNWSYDYYCACCKVLDRVAILKKDFTRFKDLILLKAPRQDYIKYRGGLMPRFRRSIIIARELSQKLREPVSQQSINYYITL